MFKLCPVSTFRTPSTGSLPKSFAFGSSVFKLFIIRTCFAIVLALSPTLKIASLFPCLIVTISAPVSLYPLYLFATTNPSGEAILPLVIATPFPNLLNASFWFPSIKSTCCSYLVALTFEYIRSYCISCIGVSSSTVISVFTTKFVPFVKCPLLTDFWVPDTNILIIFLPSLVYVETFSIFNPSPYNMLVSFILISLTASGRTISYTDVPYISDSSLLLLSSTTNSTSLFSTIEYSSCLFVLKVAFVLVFNNSTEDIASAILVFSSLPLLFSTILTSLSKLNLFRSFKRLIGYLEVVIFLASLIIILPSLSILEDL